MPYLNYAPESVTARGEEIYSSRYDTELNQSTKTSFWCLILKLETMKLTLKIWKQQCSYLPSTRRLLPIVCGSDIRLPMASALTLRHTQNEGNSLSYFLI